MGYRGRVLLGWVLLLASCEAPEDRLGIGPVSSPDRWSPADTAEDAHSLGDATGADGERPDARVDGRGDDQTPLDAGRPDQAGRERGAVDAAPCEAACDGGASDAADAASDAGLQVDDAGEAADASAGGDATHVPDAAGLDVTDGVPAKLRFYLPLPNTVLRHATWPAFSVRIDDWRGVLVRDADVAVTVTIADGRGLLGGTTVVRAQGGFATFADLRYDVAESVIVGFAADGMPVLTGIVQVRCDDACAFTGSLCVDRYEERCYRDSEGCRLFDRSFCPFGCRDAHCVRPICGDGVVDGTEICDPGSEATPSAPVFCEDLSPSFTGGWATCAAGCDAWDTRLCERQQVDAAAMTSPADCATVAASDSTTLGFEVFSTEGIEGFLVDVAPVAGCGAEPSSGSELCYPLSLPRARNTTVTLQRLRPSQWYRVVVYSQAQLGYSSASATLWFRTAAGLDRRWATISAGDFQMGSPADELGRFQRLDAEGQLVYTNESRHQVTAARDLEVRVTEVTQCEFAAVMGYLPARATSCGRECPVEWVSWHEAAAFCNALSDRAELPHCYTCAVEASGVRCAWDQALASPVECTGYRLPTEAEWERVTRAGSTTATYGGDLESGQLYCAQPNDTMDALGWTCGNSGGGVHPVGELWANAWGLFDTLGNVREWCQDWATMTDDPFLGTVLADYPTAALTDPWGPATGRNRIVRGGSWRGAAIDARAAARDHLSPGSRADDVGFRVVRTLP